MYGLDYSVLAAAAANQGMPRCCRMQVGNKSDLKHLRDVQTEVAQAFCEREVSFRMTPQTGCSPYCADSDES